MKAKVPDASDPVKTTFCAPNAAAEPTATVTVTGEPGRTVDELKLTLTPASVEADKVTAFLAEPLSVTEMMKEAEFPA